MIDKIKDLRQVLEGNIKGQSHVIEKMLPTLSRGKLGLSDPMRPKGSFLFVGPTGTGKTEITKLFTEHLLGEKKLIRIDMSEFSDESALKRFLGSEADPVGFFGYQIEWTKGQGTILLDEIEKANKALLDLLLQILDALYIIKKLLPCQVIMLFAPPILGPLAWLSFPRLQQVPESGLLGKY